MTRRTFMEAAAGIPVAASSFTLVSSTPLAAVPDTTHWWLWPVRLYHPNMRESELRGMDVPRFVRDCAATNADGIVVSAGGIFGFYPSKVRYHYVSPNLDGHDFLGEVIAQCHAVGLRAIARVDFSKARGDVFADHPEWFARNADGSPKVSGQYYEACPNSDYAGAEFGIPVIREILNGYAVDGFHINAGGFPGYCYCKNCKEQFRAKTGMELPTTPNWNDATWKQFMSWRYQCSAANFALLQKTIFQMRGDFFWTGELAGLDNPTWMRDKAYDMVELSRSFSSLMATIDDSAPTPDLRWVTGMTTSYVRSVGERPPIVNLKAPMRSAGWMHASMPSAEYAQCAWQVLAHGGGLKMPTFGIPGNIEDERNLAVIAETMGVLKKHSWVYNDVRPVAPIALVWSQKTLELYGQQDPGSRYAECVHGLYAALVENHIPAVVVSDECLSSERLSSFRAVVLPNLACISDEQARAVTEFVRRGGGLVATHETSLYDSSALKRPQLALEEVLGARYDGTLRAPTDRNAYFCRKQPHDVISWMKGTSVLPFSGRVLPVREVGSGEAPLIYGRNTKSSIPEEMENPKRTDLPLLVTNSFGSGRAVFFPCDIDRFFFRSRLPDPRRLLGSAVQWTLHAPPLLSTNAPGAVELIVTDKPGYRFIHFVNTVGSRPLDEVTPINDVKVSLQVGGKVKAVRTLLGAEKLEFTQDNGRVSCVVTRVPAYEVVVMEMQSA
jgi:hypothetical protein